MTIKVYNKTFPYESIYNRIITGNSLPVPRIGERIMLGYDPAAKVTDVIWNMETGTNNIEIHNIEILVVVE